jgi:hypothetical protein
MRKILLNIIAGNVLPVLCAVVIFCHYKLLEPFFLSCTVQGLWTQKESLRIRDANLAIDFIYMDIFTRCTIFVHR